MNKDGDNLGRLPTSYLTPESVTEICKAGPDGQIMGVVLDTFYFLAWVCPSYEAASGVGVKPDLRIEKNRKLHPSVLVLSL